MITGAGSGIGRGLAGLAAADGWHVIATDLDRHAAEEAARTILAQGGKAEAFALDVTCSDSIRQLMERCPAGASIC